jgi:hypothetical protein
VQFERFEIDAFTFVEQLLASWVTGGYLLLKMGARGRSGCSRPRGIGVGTRFDYVSGSGPRGTAIAPYHDFIHGRVSEARNAAAARRTLIDRAGTEVSRDYGQPVCIDAMRRTTNDVPISVRAPECAPFG